MRKIFFILILIFLVSCDSTQTPISNTQEIPVEITEETSQNSDSDIIPGNYINDAEQFSMNIPGEYDLDQDNPEYIRVQNYIATDAPFLNEGEYYLEIFTFDDTNKYICNKMVFNSQVQEFGSVTGLIGDGGQGGDSGGFRKAVCVNKNNKTYYFQAVGNGSGEDTIQEIFQSISFY